MKNDLLKEGGVLITLNFIHPPLNHPSLPFQIFNSYYDIMFRKTNKIINWKVRNSLLLSFSVKKSLNIPSSYFYW